MFDVISPIAIAHDQSDPRREGDWLELKREEEYPALSSADIARERPGNTRSFGGAPRLPSPWPFLDGTTRRRQPRHATLFYDLRAITLSA